MRATHPLFNKGNVVSLQCGSGNLKNETLVSDRPTNPNDVTRLLENCRGGDPQAVELLFSLVYEDLHRLARREMYEQPAGHTLQPTALVNEAYVRLVAQARKGISNREHFMAVAAKAMRFVLIDHARGKAADKRSGGNRSRIELDGIVGASERRGVNLLALDEALTKLERLNPERLRLVELRFFGGLTIEEAAGLIGTSPATVKREWAAVRVWLFRELSGESSSHE